MTERYEKVVSELVNDLKFINSVVVADLKGGIIYSTEKWDSKSDIEDLIVKWNSLSRNPFFLKGKKYLVRRLTKERLIASSTSKESHLIGVKNNKKALIATIEYDGIIPLATTEMARALSSFESESKFLKRDIKFKSFAETKKSRDSHIEQDGKKKRVIGRMKEKRKPSEVPFTARLMAYYRGQENKRDTPLLIDPFGELLAGDLETYFEKHIRYSQMDYPIVRSHYIENQLLDPWCKKNDHSQIVLLGAGLDTRAYRLSFLKNGTHAIYEIDLPEIIAYKEEKLADVKPKCPLKRISANLSYPGLNSELLKNEFSREIPTFWILEGLVYYINLEKVTSLLEEIRKLSHESSEIFVDVMQRSRWLNSSEPLFNSHIESFTKHFKWGLDIKQVPQFFGNFGWEIECFFADDHAKGRDVGYKAMIFVHGRVKS